MEIPFSLIFVGYNILEMVPLLVINIFSLTIPEMLETIDDEIAKLVPLRTFVKIDDAAVAAEYGLPTDKPSLVFFENGLPK